MVRSLASIKNIKMIRRDPKNDGNKLKTYSKQSSQHLWVSHVSFELLAEEHDPTMTHEEDGTQHGSCFLVLDRLRAAEDARFAALVYAGLRLGAR
jgi:hypothetical protein